MVAIFVTQLWSSSEILPLAFLLFSFGLLNSQLECQHAVKLGGTTEAIVNDEKYPIENTHYLWDIAENQSEASIRVHL